MKHRSRPLPSTTQSIMPSLPVLTALLLAMLLRSSNAQVGVTLCACQPSTYVMTLNFSLTCADSNIAGPGVNDTACTIENRLSNADEVPVSVSFIEVLELNQIRQPISQSTYDQGFVDGDSFLYTSVIISRGGNETTLPLGIQINLVGQNAAGEAVDNFLIILFSNDCSVFPVLTEGQTIGWVEFTDLGDPLEQYCPVAFDGSDVPSDTPSSAPMAVVTPAPVTTAPTQSPTLSPTPRPVTVAPTPAPVVPPTPTPSKAPITTPAPTVPRANTSPPTPAPVTPAPTVNFNAPTCSPVAGGSSKKSKGSKAGKKVHSTGKKVPSTEKKDEGDEYYGKMAKSTRGSSGSSSPAPALRFLKTGGAAPSECPDDPPKKKSSKKKQSTKGMAKLKEAADKKEETASKAKKAKLSKGSKKSKGMMMRRWRD